MTVRFVYAGLGDSPSVPHEHQGVAEIAHTGAYVVLNGSGDSPSLTFVVARVSDFTVEF